MHNSYSGDSGLATIPDNLSAYSGGKSVKAN